MTQHCCCGRNNEVTQILFVPQYGPVALATTLHILQPRHQTDEHGANEHHPACAFVWLVSLLVAFVRADALA